MICFNHKSYYKYFFYKILIFQSLRMTGQTWVVEDDFVIIDKKDFKSTKKWNLKDDLINMGFLDYENLSDGDKKVFDELDEETREEE